MRGPSSGAVEGSDPSFQARLRSGEHVVPEAALEALADQNIPFTVQGKTSYEQQVAALRGSASSSV